MPTWGPTTTFNEGHAPLGAIAPVAHISARLVAGNSSKTEYFGTIAPRGTWQVGSFGLGSWPDDSWASNPPFHLFLRFLRSEYEDVYIPADNAGLFYAPSVWWRWLPGVTVEMTVFW